MPTSALEVAPAVLNYLWQIRPQDRPLKVLDVGPGRGKYGLLIREYVDPEATVIALEAWEPYVADFGLEHLYAEVIVGDVRDQPAEFFDPFDAVLMVDIIEHVPKEDGLEVIDKIPGWIIVSTPRHFFDNPPDLPEPERHLSHWTPSDFAGTGRLDLYHRRIFNDLAGIVARLRPKT